MRKLILALVTAGLVLFNPYGYSADESAVKSRSDSNNPVRTIAQTSVKPRPDPNMPGRTLEETAGTVGDCGVPILLPVPSGPFTCRI